MTEKPLQNHALCLAVLILMPWSWKCMVATGQCIRLKRHPTISQRPGPPQYEHHRDSRSCLQPATKFWIACRRQRLFGRQNLLGRLWSGASSKSRLQGEWLPCHAMSIAWFNLTIYPVLVAVSRWVDQPTQQVKLGWILSFLLICTRSLAKTSFKTD